MPQLPRRNLPGAARTNGDSVQGPRACGYLLVPVLCGYDVSGIMLSYTGQVIILEKGAH